MKKNITLLIVSFAMLMEAVDTTIINTAIPVMARSLNVNPIDLKLALISYLLSLAIFIPVSGWIADKFGIKKVFISAIAIFTLSSMWCGFTNNLWELIIARVVQGLGGSLTMPVGRLIILRTCERHELIAKMSLVVMVASLGMLLGPLLGGVITHNFSWRWIFWVNIPLGLVAILLSIKLLPSMPPRKVHTLDKSGFILFGSGLATLTFSLSMFSETNVNSSHAVTLFILSLLLLIVYAQHSRKKHYPIIKMELLHTRTFCISVVSNLFGRLSFGGTPFLLPLMLQIGLNYNSQLSGFLLAPIALGVFLVKPMSVYILRFLGYKRLLILNTLLVSIALWSFCSINASSTIYEIGLLTFSYGFLIALQYTAMNSLAYANIEEKDMSAATSIMSTIQQLTQSFGVAISAIFISFFSSHHFLNLKTFHETFFMLGVLTLISGIIFLNLKKEDGEELVKSQIIESKNH
ncbi:MAG: DHA2 family efflux MFS transporter permease subunit [Legionella sp.]|uniref:DHA2 family efflux MFS transporter permease subunit n=1 Tax=Legionella sp. TaxID=459 RepID=UPI0039E45607